MRGSGALLRMVPSPVKQVVRRSLSVLRGHTITVCNNFGGIRGINIGAGDWAEFGWIGIDARHASTSTMSTVLNADSVFPHKDKTFRAAYSSMFFEHVDDAVAMRLLQETRRVLRPEAVFRICVPNFGRCIEAYKNGDDMFFDQVWGMEIRYENWQHHSVAKSLENKLLFAFASWENMDCNALPFPPWRYDPSYYCGPPIINSDQVREAVASLDEEAFSRWAVSWVPADRLERSHGHINCYPHAKMIKMALAAGFRDAEASPFRGSKNAEFNSESFDKRAHKNISLYYDLTV